MRVVDEVALRVRAVWQGDEVKQGVSQLEGQARQLSHTLRTIVGIAGFGGIAYTMKQLVASAIQTNIEMQRASTGIAAVLFQYTRILDAQGRVLANAEKFNASLALSRQLMSQIVDIAAKTILETQELMQYTQTGLGYAMAKGLSPERALELISMVAQTGRVLGLPPGYPIVSEIRAVLTGQNLRASQIAQAFGLSQRELSSLTGEALFAYIRSKLQGMVEAQEAFSRTLEARWTTLMSEWSMLLREVSEGFVDVISDVLPMVTQAIQRWRASGGALALREIFASIARTVIDVARILWDTIVWLKKNDLLGVIAGTVGGRALLMRLGMGSPAATALSAGATAIYAGAQSEGPWWQKALMYTGGGAAAGGALGSFIPGIGTAAGILGGGVAGLSTFVGAEYLLPWVREFVSPKTLSTGGGGGGSSGAGELGVGSLTPPPSFRYEPLPIPKPSDVRKAAEEARRQRRTEHERLEAQQILHRVRLEGLRKKVSDAIDVARSEGYTESSVNAVMQALSEWAKERRKIIVPQGTSPELVAAWVKEAEADIAQYVEDTRRTLREGRDRYIAQQEQSRRAYSELWASWRETITPESPVSRARREAERTFARYMPLGVVHAFVAAGVSAYEVLAPVMQRAQEQALLNRMRQQEDLQRTMEKSWSEWLAGYLRTPRGLPAQVREKIYGERLQAAMGYLSSLVGMGLVGPEVAGVLAKLSQLYDQWEQDVRDRQQAFWDWMGRSMEQSVRDAFVRLGYDLIRHTRNWMRSFRDFASAIGSMIERAILEAIYEQIIRAAVERLIAWIIAQIQRAFGVQGGSTGQSLGVAAGLGGPTVFGRSLSYAAAGASLGSVAGPGGALVGAAVGFMAGLLGLQHGGSVIPRRAYVVGEGGPEVFIPETLGRIVPSRPAQASMSQTTVYVQLPPGTDAMLARAIGREMAWSMRIARW